ncbi:glycosyltransferase family 2 protein [Rhodobacter sp. SGA-6-6]|uniref:glycosyltransferase family 2 protein n=1 Tax=Rhodobacter sp. SGA-6-6 TaxID=2710882 RepID=UPI0013EA0586|nr:glycosyltransferase family 2 protein [Rhodobacter sp. SGA-6-6]NGM45722.1 glycosyltransferase family 2 protein [Rhodobacter sp. SGA-6-6]
MAAALPDWGLVATVRAAPEKVAAFVAHHLSLGAARIWLYFDDPADPAVEPLSRIPQVTATRCDDVHWERLRGRPDRHQNRQSKNARAAYKACLLPWLGHIDVDEFLWPSRTVAEILASLPPGQPTLRMEPFEAMHDPALPDDIFTARAFRGPLKQRFAHLRPAVLGSYAGILPEGHLSHTNGKSFFRTGIPDLSPRLHGAFLKGERLPGPPFDRRLPLLHFHAQDREDWLKALPFRLTRGAYQYHAGMQAHLSAAGPEEIGFFYDRTQCLSPDLAALLREEGRLIEADLHLREKVAQLVRGAAGE